MKANTKIIVLALAAGIAAACHNNTQGGQNMSGEGTVQSNNVNSEMEDDRTASDVDTTLNPGSNALDLKNAGTSANGQSSAATGTPGNTGANTNPTRTSGADPNMTNQSDTHGRSTTTGK